MGGAARVDRVLAEVMLDDARLCDVVAAAAAAETPLHLSPGKHVNNRQVASVMGIRSPRRPRFV